MKVLVITEEDVFYLKDFFAYFIPLCKDKPFSIEAVTVCKSFNKKSLYDLALQMYNFYGFFHFIRLGFLYVFFLLTGNSVKGLCRKHGLSLWNTDDVNDPMYIRKIKEHGIDCIVSVAAPQVFKKELLESVPRGCINSHSALLPKNRGMMPIFWSLYNGDVETGVTIHYMNEKLDKGDILLQKKVTISTKCLHKLIVETKRISANLLIEVLERFSKRIAMDSRPVAEGGTYNTFPTRQDVREFKKRGCTFF